MKRTETERDCLHKLDGFIALRQPTRIMMRQVKGELGLNQKEEKPLLEKAKKGDRKSRNRLAVSFLWVATREAKKFYGVSFDDSVQAGAEKITTDILKFKREKGAPKSFFRQSVRRAMSDQIAQMYKPFSIPYYQVQILGKLRRVWEQQAQELKRLPSAKELVDGLRKSVKTRGHVRIDEESVSGLLRLLDLPLSWDESENQADFSLAEKVPDCSSESRPDSTINSERKAQIFFKVGEIIAEHEAALPGFFDCRRATELVYGLGGEDPLTQLLAAKKLGVAQTSVSSRVRKFRAVLAADNRLQILYQELQEIS